LDVGISVPTNDNYNAHAEEGAGGGPYAGYMFTDNFGVQAQLHAAGQPPDKDNRGFKHENQWSSLLGFTVGPRFDIPMGNAVPYLTFQGGVFTGLSGRLSGTGAGMSAGGGLDYYLTHNFALSVFGRFNFADIEPRPAFLGPPVTGGAMQAAEDQGPTDINWVTAGLGVKYDFRTAPPPPPPPAPVARAPEPTPVVKRKIVLRSVHFDFDKSDIRPDAKPVLDEAVATLKEEGGVAVIVQGHTDSIGTEAYNQKLSERRAQSVRRYLVDHGIPADRIKAEGYGESQPVATNDSADGRAQNRRVELRVD
jgi:outer membrane protein OmpA-like peptidoglycan-associated protein